MDIPIKAKSYELEAVTKLNSKAPEIYKGKNPGFYWAAHQASLNSEAINWKEVAEYRLEEIFTGKGFEENSNSVNHLTLDDLDYEITASSMTKFFDLKRPVQKAYCARNIIKWAIMQLEEKGRMAVELDDNMLSLEDFKELTVDEKLNKIYELLLNR